MGQASFADGSNVAVRAREGIDQARNPAQGSRAAQNAVSTIVIL